MYAALAAPPTSTAQETSTAPIVNRRFALIAPLNTRGDNRVARPLTAAYFSTLQGLKTVPCTESPFLKLNSALACRRPSAQWALA